MAKPVIKWAGGKSRMLEEIRKRIPEGEYRRYIEPFFGGGAVFFGLAPHDGIIGDINGRLVGMYGVIRDDPDGVMGRLDQIQEEYGAFGSMQEKERYFKAVRDKLNRHAGVVDAESAAWFIFLNKTGFNGLYRENRSGKFNVPFGKRDGMPFYDRDNLMAVSRMLPAHIRCGGYMDTVQEADPQAGDFVFFDSPYVGTFSQYSSHGFSWEEHVRLRDLFSELTDRGCLCLATNSDCHEVRELYHGYRIDAVDFAHGMNRAKAGEVIITNYSHPAA